MATRLIDAEFDAEDAMSDDRPLSERLESLSADAREGRGVADDLLMLTDCAAALEAEVQELRKALEWMARQCDDCPELPGHECPVRHLANEDMPEGACYQCWFDAALKAAEEDCHEDRDHRSDDDARGS